jgi:hypothetical protein
MENGWLDCLRSGTGGTPPRFPWLADYPDLLGRRTTERNCSGIGSERQSLIIVPPRNVHSRSGANPSTLQKFQQVPVAFVDSTNHIVLPGFSMGQKHKPASPAAAGTLKFAKIAVRTGSTAAQLGEQAGFEVR